MGYSQLSYREFYNRLGELMPDFDIILGTTKKGVLSQTVFIQHDSSRMIGSDNAQMVLSSQYDLIFLQESASFQNMDVIELTVEGVTFNSWNAELGMNVFTASVVLFGPASVPKDGDD